MKKKIYIVDDEPKIGELFVTVLNRDGYDAQAFVNPQALLDKIDQKKMPGSHSDGSDDAGHEWD